MTLKRSPTWLTKELPDYLLAHLNTPFEWGTNDCCLFAAGAVLAMTGVDIAEDFRGKYHDEASAFAIIEAVTGGTDVLAVLQYVANKYGLVEWTKADKSPLPLMAKRGDLVAVHNDGNIIAGIVDLTGRTVAAATDKGFVRLPLSAIERAWHISAS